MSICFFYDDWKTFLSYYTLPSSNLSYWKSLEEEKKNVGHFLYANLTAADLGENWKLRKISCNVSKRRSQNSGEEGGVFFSEWFPTLLFPIEPYSFCSKWMVLLSSMIPTQDKNRPKADFCPSGFINFGQQKTCAPIRIFCFCFQTSHRGWSTAKNVCKIL